MMTIPPEFTSTDPTKKVRRKKYLVRASSQPQSSSSSPHHNLKDLKDVGNKSINRTHSLKASSGGCEATPTCTTPILERKAIVLNKLLSSSLLLLDRSSKKSVTSSIVTRGNGRTIIQEGIGHQLHSSSNHHEKAEEQEDFLVRNPREANLASTVTSSLGLFRRGSLPLNDNLKHRMRPAVSVDALSCPPPISITTSKDLSTGEKAREKIRPAVAAVGVGVERKIPRLPVRTDSAVENEEDVVEEKEKRLLEDDEKTSSKEDDNTSISTLKDSEEGLIILAASKNLQTSSPIISPSLRHHYPNGGQNTYNNAPPQPPSRNPLRLSISPNPDKRSGGTTTTTTSSTTTINSNLLRTSPVGSLLTSPTINHKMRVTQGRSDSDSGFEFDLTTQDPIIKQVDFDKEYDVVQKIGEGWFSRVYLTEHRSSREEVVLKAINSKKVTTEEFIREYENSYKLSAHKNILTIYDVVFQSEGYYMFATEYAPLGDLTSNVISERGIGETNTKKVAKQIGSALEWVHSKNLCHLDVKLDNILVFKSDFSKIKLCDFGSVRSQGDIVIKKNELLPYCPPELVAKHANEYYQVDKVQDVFQFGIVVYFCLFGILPWQRADTKTDPNFTDFYQWRKKKSSKMPKNFKPLTSRAQKFFRKLLDPDPTSRLNLTEIPKYTEDKWIRKKMGVPSNSMDVKWLSDGFSQLTMGSFQSVHSNAVEKNRVLFTLLQHGVETTVDRTQKNSRIIHWIQNGTSESAIPSIDVSLNDEGDNQFLS